MFYYNKMPIAFVFFSARWCGSCTSLKPKFERYIQSINVPDMFVYMVDIDEQKQFAAKYNVKAVPEIIVFSATKEGKIVQELDGIIGPDESAMRDFINHHLKHNNMKTL